MHVCIMYYTVCVRCRVPGDQRAQSWRRGAKQEEESAAVVVIVSFSLPFALASFFCFVSIMHHYTDDY